MLTEACWRHPHHPQTQPTHSLTSSVGKSSAAAAAAAAAAAGAAAAAAGAAADLDTDALIARLLRPSGYTRNPLDYSTAWQLLQVLKALGKLPEDDAECE